MKYTQIALLAALSVSALSSHAAVIAVDARVHPGGTANIGTHVNFAEMRNRLVDMGHTVVIVTGYDAGTLDGVDVLLTREAVQADHLFTSTMADQIAAFNNNGGGVAFFADGGFGSTGLISSNNLVANALGANLVGNAYAGSGTVITDFNAHPVTAGVNQWALDFVRQVDALPGSVDLTVNDGQQNVAVARDGVGSQGNAFVMGDASWLASPGDDFGINSLDNSQAFTNIINYLVPSPSATALAGIAGVAAARRRRS